MKKNYYFLGLALGFMSFLNPVMAQDSTGLPGDNFSLQGALAMFQKASSPEDFEKLINSEGNHVNNLDLNEDGEIDYVQVIDHMDKEVHAFVLQVAVSETESQDVAVIELEKTGKESAIIQIVGDEDIYGEQIIVEPGNEESDQAYEADQQNLVARGPSVNLDAQMPVVVFNVWFWPSVRYVYGPRYVVYRSPWRWHYYPRWWSPWKPVRWHVFHPYRVRYQRTYVVVPTHRVVRAHQVYVPVRKHSVTVRTRYAAPVKNYRVSRTKTTVTGPNGRSATRTTTKVKGKNGKVKASKTTTKRRRN